MKWILLTLFMGLTLLYFIDAAFKISILDLELLTHSAIRFFVGFFIVGVWFLYAHKIKFKTLLIFISCIVIADDVYDYYRNVDSFSPQILLHSLYVILWGAVTGYLTTKHIMNIDDL